MCVSSRDSDLHKMNRSICSLPLKIFGWISNDILIRPSGREPLNIALLVSMAAPLIYICIHWCTVKNFPAC